LGIDSSQGISGRKRKSRIKPRRHLSVDRRKFDTVGKGEGIGCDFLILLTTLFWRSESWVALSTLRKQIEGVDTKEEK